MRRLIASLIVLAPSLGWAQERVTMQAAGLQEPAEILVDRWGVPHIYARNLDDAFFAQGFNAARDRLFQIDLWRRRGLGKLAEVLGPSYVDQDRAARLFLYRGDMEAEWSVYGPDASRIASAFVSGVNAYVDWLGDNPDRMPVEFTLLGYEPAKWEAGDVVRIRSHGLTRNLESEVERAKVVCAADPLNGPKYDQVRLRLEPQWETQVPDGLDPCLPDNVLDVFHLATRGVRVVGARGEDSNEGSNNWTIAPAKSATGRPILANDPHRAYSTPSLRYIAHLSAPSLDIIGAGEPALPGISIGHNGTIAFGLTIFELDQEDLYAYELNPENPREYRYNNGWEPMRAVRETIAVKGGERREVELLFTRHGPVIYSDPAGRRAYALRTCWLEPGMAPYFGSIGYIRARNFRDFQRAMLHWGAPTENLVYADADGNIGWVAGGLAPVRPNWDGLMPVPGDGRFEWNGFWSGDQLPSSYNPAAAYITTSNQMNLPDGYPYAERKLGFEWVNVSRHERIEEVLQALPKVSIEDSMKLQYDQTSIPARRLVALLAPLEADGLAGAALDYLRGWDGVERVDSGQAALMELWIDRHLRAAFREAVLPEGAARAMNTTDIGVLLDGLENPTAWFTNEGSRPVEKRDRLLLSTLAAAYAETEKLLGSDASEWTWGRLHQSFPAHVLTGSKALSDRPDLRSKLQPGPFPTGGSAYTPNQASFRSSDFRQTSGPSFRMVLDVGGWDNSRAVNYPGQSGNPAGPHYRDLTQMWLDGAYFPLLYTREAVEGATEVAITLEPVAE